MKNFILLILACLCLCECKHEDYVPDCACTDIEIIIDYGPQEGQIIFPTNRFKSYSIKPKKFFIGGVSTQYIICTDSTFVKQIKEKQIKDSSQVIMTGIGGGNSGYCNIFLQRTPIYPDPLLNEAPAVIRIVTIDKK
jgi:hypothetical protein